MGIAMGTSLEAFQGVHDAGKLTKLGLDTKMTTTTISSEGCDDLCTVVILLFCLIYHYRTLHT
jgi:hypothetical protein